jgi:hypothetical protein
MTSVTVASRFTYAGKVGGIAFCACGQSIEDHAHYTLACPVVTPTCNEPGCPVCPDLRRHA